LYGQPLEKVASEKDLVVVFSNDLKLGGNVRKLTVRPAKCWGSLTEQYSVKILALLPLYKPVVRPHSAVWSPQYVKDKALLEKVQHRFSRMFPE